MPYVKEDQRSALNPLSARTPKTAGELNFQLTQLARFYIAQNGLSYQSINDVVGALEGAKAEFQRRVVAPYEDSKIRDYGDVYGPQG